MADRSRPDPTPTSEASFSSSENHTAPRPTGRPVYESTLLPTRKRRRFSPWLVVPILLVILFSVFYFLVFGPKPRRAVATAGTVVYASDVGSPGVCHLWIAPLSGGAAHPLTSGASSESSPVFTADGNQVAYLSNRGGQNQIWLMDGDGKNSVQITRTSGAKASPAFAPGSNVLLGFLSGASLAAMNVNKSDASLILPTPGGSTRPDSTDPNLTTDAAVAVTTFAWQPGAADKTSPGLAAVLENAGVQTLAVIPALGSTPRLTQNDQPNGPPLAAADSLSPAWAPDGSRLAVALLHVQGLPGGKKASALLQFDTLGNIQKPLLPVLQGPAIGPQNPVFSPDGSQLTFELWRQVDLVSRTRLGLYIVTADGTGQPHPLVRGDAGSVQFSPDGKQVFFLRRRSDSGHDLCRIGADGTGQTRVSDGKADVTGFTLSPQSGQL